MGQKTTFFIVDRKLLEDPLWLGEPFTKGQAWIDLIGRASYEDGPLTKRGQLLTSERSLAKRWNWTRKRVQCFLKSLESQGMIQRSNKRTTSSTTNGTTITIENYGKYQSKGTNKGTNKGTTEGAVYNNINNLNNISLNMPDGMAEDLKSLYGDRTSALLEDVRRYYESHPEKEFPGWPIAVAQFNSNQQRWGKTKPKRKTNEEIAAEVFAEIEKEERNK